MSLTVDTELPPLQQQQQQQEDDVAANHISHSCGCLWWLCIPGIPSILLICICLGLSNGFSSAEIPNLLNETFSHPYEINAYSNAGKGVYIITMSAIAGSLSDLIGRKPVIIGGIVLCVVSPASYFITGGNIEIWWFIDLLAGVIFVLLSLMYAAVADLVKGDPSGAVAIHAPTPDEVDKLLAVINSICLASYMSVIFVSKIGSMVSTAEMFLLVLFSNVGALLVAIFLLPNTGAKIRKQQLIAEEKAAHEQPPLNPDESDRSPLLAVNSSTPSNVETMETPTQQGEGEAEQEEKPTFSVVLRRVWALVSTNRNVALLCGVAALNAGDAQVFSTSALLYLKKSLKFSASDISDFLIVTAITSVLFVVVITVLGRTNALAKNAKTLIYIALLGGFILSVGFALIKTKFEALAVTTSLLLALAGPPCISAAGPLVVQPEEYGVAVGVMAAARGVTQTLMPLVYGVLFREAEESSFPGWPFLVGCGLVVCAAILMCFVELHPPEAEEQVVAESQAAELPETHE